MLVTVLTLQKDARLRQLEARELATLSNCSRLLNWSSSAVRSCLRRSALALPPQHT